MTVIKPYRAPMTVIKPYRAPMTVIKPYRATMTVIKPYRTPMTAPKLLGTQSNVMINAKTASVVDYYRTEFIVAQL